MARALLGRPARGLLSAAVVLLLAGCSGAQPGPATVASSAASTPRAARTAPLRTVAPAPAVTPSRVPAPASSAPVPQPRSTASGSWTPTRPASTTPPAAASSAFDRTAHSLDDPASIWVVVDKKRPLQPKSWVPPDLVTPDVPHTNVPRLRRVASAALVRMFAAAKQDGVRLVSLSAYRSFATQRSIFDRNLASLGRATTLKLTAKPGYSEHQTGLTDDLGDGSSCDLQVCFESHPAARWLSEHSWRYGFIQRYPTGYTRITGIQVEPWHFRYIGAGLAREMHRTGVKTLEQFFHLPPAPDY
jgi:D-alanyl-D-alanine carboxypeptidase